MKRTIDNIASQSGECEKMANLNIVNPAIDLEKVKQTLDNITAQIEHRKKNLNRTVWLSIDFEKVKQRINTINAKLDEVHRKFNL